MGLLGETEALDRQPGPEAWPGRFVVFLVVSLQGLLPGEGLLALLAGEGGPGHGRLQSQVEFDAERGKYLDIITRGADIALPVTLGGVAQERLSGHSLISDFV